MVFLHSIFQGDWVFSIILDGQNEREFDIHQAYHDRYIAHEYDQYAQWGPFYAAPQSSAFQAPNPSTDPPITSANSQYAAAGRPQEYVGSAGYPMQEWHYTMPQEMAYAQGTNLNI